MTPDSSVYGDGCTTYRDQSTVEPGSRLKKAGVVRRYSTDHSTRACAINRSSVLHLVPGTSDERRRDGSTLHLRSAPFHTHRLDLCRVLYSGLSVSHRVGFTRGRGDDGQRTKRWDRATRRGRHIYVEYSRPEEELLRLSSHAAQRSTPTVVHTARSPERKTRRGGACARQVGALQCRGQSD